MALFFTATFTAATLVLSVAVPEKLMVVVFGTVAPSAGELMVVSGLGPIAPPGAKAYRNPSELAM